MIATDKKLTKWKIRSMLRARAGCVLIQCDLSQAETWIVAYLANCWEMKDALLNSDIHTKTASAIFHIPFDEVKKDGEERYTGKRINHASSYRMSPERFTQVYNKDAKTPISNAQSKQYQKAWHGLYPEIKNRWWASIDEELNRSRTLITPYGFKRVFFAQWGNELKKEATAFVPQSTVAHHFNGLVQRELGISGGLLEVKRQIVDKSHGEISIVNQSHDSALLEVPTTVRDEVANQFVSLLRRPVLVNNEEVNIPVDCEIGERWGEFEKFKAA